MSRKRCGPHLSQETAAERAAALDPWLNYYNTERIHAAIKGTPITRVSLT